MPRLDPAAVLRVLLLGASLLFAADDVIAPDSAAVSAAPRFAQVIVGSAQIYQELSPTAPVLGMVMRGASFPLIGTGQTWCKVSFKGKEGWIQRDNIEIVDTPNKGFVLRDMAIVFGSIGGVLLLLFITIVISRARNKVKGEWFDVSARTDKKVLIVCSGETPVRRFLGDSQITLATCFAEIGCECKAAADAITLQRSAISFQPDIIAVDWHLGSNAQSTVEQVLSSRGATASVFVVFYNAPDPASIAKSAVLPYVAYLPIGFGEQDLLNAIMPALSGSIGQSGDSIRKSVERSALQGEISEGSLAAIFQFVDIGRKTGCLMIEDDKPAGIVYFDSGIITHAVSRRGSGQKALMDMLAFESGYFRFVLDRKPQTETMKVPALSVLMEWAKEHDEASGNRLR